MVGLSRNIKYRWLNKTVDFVKEGKTDQEVKENLHDYLSFEIKSKDNLRKTREILLNIWLNSKYEYPSLHEKALRLLEKYPDDALAIHWCMMLLAYPVLSDLSVLLANMSEYQEEITTAQLKQKMFDEWGERTTVFHSTDKIIMTLKDMEILSCDKPGRYKVIKHSIESEDIVLFMIHTALNLKEGSYYSISDLGHIKLYFAFDYKIDNTSIFEDDRLILSNFGGKQTVSLK